MAGGIVNFIIRCFKKGNGAEEVAKDVSEAKKQVGLFGKGLEALGGTANMAGRMLRNVLTGSMWEAGARGVMLLWEKFNEWKEAAKKAAEEAAKATADAFTRAADRIKGAFKEVADSIKGAAKFNDAWRGLNSAKGDLSATNESLSVDSATRRRLEQAKTNEEKAVIQAEAALAKAKLAEAQQTRKSTSEREAMDEKLAGMQEEHDAAVVARNKLDATARMMGNDARWELSQGNEEGAKAIWEAQKKVIGEYKAVVARIEELEDGIRNGNLERQSLREKIKKDELVAHDAVVKAEYDRAEAEKNLAKARRAEELKKENERLEMERQLNEHVEKIRKEERQKEAKEIVEKEQEKAKNDLSAIDRQIKDISKEIAKIAERRKETGKGMDADHRNHNGLFGAYQYQTNASGVIDNLTDWERAQRYKGRADRDEATRAKRAETQDRRMEEIGRRISDGKYVSDFDRRRYGRWQQFKEERDGEDRRKKQIEQLQQKREKAVIDSEKHLKEIRKKMEEFINSGVMN